MTVWPLGPVSLRLAARACGFDTTTANGECCASSTHTFIDLQVKPLGQPPPGSQAPDTVLLPVLPHACIDTFLTPGTPMQPKPPWTSSTSTALSRSTAMY